MEEKQIGDPSSFNKDEIESEKNGASILNDESDNKIEDLMKIDNIKKHPNIKENIKFMNLILITKIIILIFIKDN